MEEGGGGGRGVLCANDIRVGRKTNKTNKTDNIRCGPAICYMVTVAGLLCFCRKLLCRDRDRPEGFLVIFPC